MYTARLFNPTGSDRVAVATVFASSAKPGHGVLQISRGPRAKQLDRVGVSEPFLLSEAGQHWQSAIDQLTTEGFRPDGMHALLAELGHDNSAVRARAALRLGRLAERLRTGSVHAEIVNALLAALPKAVDDVCSVLDALGQTGHPQAIAAVRPYAERKLLSRRRSAVEALLRLGDAEGVAAARQRAVERLPTALVPLLEQPGKLAAELEKLDGPEQGPALDTLYEIGSPSTVRAVAEFLPKARLDRPGVCRGVKSVFKRTLLRGDAATFGRLAFLLDIGGRKTTGFSATVKSGYDGVERSTRLFGRATQMFLRRLTWRHLRTLARQDQFSQPPLGQQSGQHSDLPSSRYAEAAAEVLIHYTPNELAQPTGLSGPFAPLWSASHILFAGGTRFAFDSRNVRVRFRSAQSAKLSKSSNPPKPPAREEAFAELWDRSPRAVFRLLTAAQLSEAHELAHHVIRANLSVRMSEPVTELIRSADVAVVLGMVSAPFEPTVLLALAELERRFLGTTFASTSANASGLDWSLLERVLCDGRPAVRTVGLRWLSLTAARWAAEPNRAVAFLTLPDAEVRLAVADALLAELARAVSLQPQRPTWAAPLALAVRAALRQPEAVAGQHESLSRVAREGLLSELLGLFTVEELLETLATGSAGAQAVAGDVLARSAEAAAKLGLERMVPLANHALIAVRSAAVALLTQTAQARRRDPEILSALFALGDSDWPDVRAGVSALLREVADPAQLGLTGLVGLLDSQRPELQAVGRELTRAHWDRLAADGQIAVLLDRLLEHPAPAMRQFALDLMLPDSTPSQPTSKPLSRRQRTVSAQPAQPPRPTPLNAPVPKLEKLVRFCRTVLMEVWPSRRAKRAVLDLVIAQGLTAPAEAVVATSLLTEVLRVQNRTDFERALAGAAQLRLAYPQLASPVAVRAPLKTATSSPLAPSKPSPSKPNFDKPGSEGKPC